MPYIIHSRIRILRVPIMYSYIIYVIMIVSPTSRRFLIPARLRAVILEAISFPLVARIAIQWFCHPMNNKSKGEPGPRIMILPRTRSFIDGAFHSSPAPRTMAPSAAITRTASRPWCDALRWFVFQCSCISPFNVFISTARAYFNFTILPARGIKTVIHYGRCAWYTRTICSKISACCSSRISGGGHE